MATANLTKIREIRIRPGLIVVERDNFERNVIATAREYRNVSQQRYTMLRDAIDNAVRSGHGRIVPSIADEYIFRGDKEYRGFRIDEGLVF